jgi:uncharacterized protein
VGVEGGGRQEPSQATPRGTAAGHADSAEAGSEGSPGDRPLRVSGYLIGAAIDQSDFYILMHGFTGAVDKVPSYLGEWLVSSRGRPVRKDDLEFLGPRDQDYFRSRGYLTALDPDEERHLLVRIAATLHETDLAQSRTGFMFVPTYVCNLRCSYCFQSHQLHAGHGPWNQILTSEQVDHAFGVVDQFAAPGAMARALGLVDTTLDASPMAQPSDIGLFGGEPLLEATLSVVTHIVSEANRRGRSVSAITNGVDLDKFVALLGPGKIRELQITLDGPADIHDRRRVGPGLRATFDKIVEGIELSLDHQVDVTVRINVDTSNIEGLDRLDDYFMKRGWYSLPNFRADAAAVTPDGKHEPLITPAQLMRKTREMRQTKGSTIESYEGYARDALLRCLTADGGYPFTRVANCSAETGLLMFDPRGHVYSCWEDVGRPLHRVAVYGQEGLQFDNDNGTKWLTRFPGAVEECSRCPYALIHKSGCAAHARSASGTIFANACESFKEYFPASLADAYSEFEEQVLVMDSI